MPWPASTNNGAVTRRKRSSEDKLWLKEILDQLNGLFCLFKVNQGLVIGR
jgi:hypothetical protein